MRLALAVVALCARCTEARNLSTVNLYAEAKTHRSHKPACVLLVSQLRLCFLQSRCRRLCRSNPLAFTNRRSEIVWECCTQHRFWSDLSHLLTSLLACSPFWHPQQTTPNSRYAWEASCVHVHLEIVSRGEVAVSESDFCAVCTA